MYKLLSTAVALLFVSGSFGATGRGLNLKRQPKVGEVDRYHIEASFSYGQRNATMSMDQLETVTDVQSDGTFQLKIEGQNCSMMVDSKPLQLASGAAIASVYSGLGQLMKTDCSEDCNAYRKANMISVVAPERPVSVGDKWERALKSDETNLVKAAIELFEVVSLEKYAGTSAAKIKFTFKETEGYDPISSEGFAYVDIANGSILDLEASFKNYPMGPAATPVEGKLLMKKG